MECKIKWVHGSIANCSARSSCLGLFYVVFRRPLFACLYFFLWPLYCLSVDLRLLITSLVSLNVSTHEQGADPGFQVRGAHLNKLRRAEGGAKIFGVFRVKNHNFTPKNQFFFQFWGGGGAPPLDPPLWTQKSSK